MKIILLFKLFCLISLASCSSHEINREYVKARITYYCGRDKWGSQVACPNTKRAKEGITVAAHPKFKFGHEIYIPQLKGVIGDGKFVVQDRGSAVTKKKASRGQAYVFDVYVSSYSKLKRFAKNQPMYMKVYWDSNK